MSDANYDYFLDDDYDYWPDYDDYLDHPEPDYEKYVPPTIWWIIRNRGLKIAIHMRLERLCTSAFYDMHVDASNNGYNLMRPGYKMPWWFSYASKLEFRLRPKPTRKTSDGKRQVALFHRR
jgi:hypothetical protein